MAPKILLMYVDNKGIRLCEELVQEFEKFVIPGADLDFLPLLYSLDCPWNRKQAT